MLSHRSCVTSALVQEIYLYAIEHEQILQYIPCFCGCDSIGHEDNASCYIADHVPDGQITFSHHGAM